MRVIFLFIQSFEDALQICESKSIRVSEEALEKVIGKRNETITLTNNSDSIKVEKKDLVKFKMLRKKLVDSIDS